MASLGASWVSCCSSSYAMDWDEQKGEFISIDNFFSLHFSNACSVCVCVCVYFEKKEASLRDMFAVDMFIQFNWVLSCSTFEDNEKLCLSLFIQILQQHDCNQSKSCMDVKLCENIQLLTKRRQSGRGRCTHDAACTFPIMSFLIQYFCFKLILLLFRTNCPSTCNWAPWCTFPLHNNILINFFSALWVLRRKKLAKLIKIDIQNLFRVITSPHPFFCVFLYPTTNTKLTTTKNKYIYKNRKSLKLSTGVTCIEWCVWNILSSIYHQIRFNFTVNALKWYNIIM